jgi:hypothetical protein
VARWPGLVGPVGLCGAHAIYHVIPCASVT